MRLKITITGPKVHDVGYRCFLMNLAMSSGIRKFEAHNMESGEGQEVKVFVDGSEETVEAFQKLIEKKRPAAAEVSSIFSEDYDREVMRITEYAQVLMAVLLNKLLVNLR
jgi:acylphosphatase